MLAKEAGLCYAAVGLVTDYDCWRDAGNKVCVDEVMHTFKCNVQNLITLMKHVIPVIANGEWDEVIDSLKVSRLKPLPNDINGKVLANEAVRSSFVSVHHPHFDVKNVGRSGSVNMVFSSQCSMGT